METMKLLNQVASHLAGRPVIVRVQPPVLWFAGGACYKSLSGDCIVDVDPGSTDVFMTFLHEVAHAKVDFPAMPPSDFWRNDPGSQALPNSTRSEMRALPRETGADAQAKVWAAYALKYYNRYSGDNEFDAKLKCLADYPKKEIENV